MGYCQVGPKLVGLRIFGSPTNFASVLVSQPRLGRVVDALGTPIDGAGPIKTTTRRRVELKVRWVGEWSQAGWVEGYMFIFCFVNFHDLTNIL